MTPGGPAPAEPEPTVGSTSGPRAGAGSLPTAGEPVPGRPAARLTPTEPIRVLLVEDSDDDAMLIVELLRSGGLDVTPERVQTAQAARAALRGRPPDVVIADYKMPTFSAEEALGLLHESELDIPFILVSGQIGEESAVDLMKAGADDFILKERLTRLVPAVQRELREAADRRQHRQAEQALRASEERFRLLAEHAADIILRYRLRPEAAVEYVSPAVAVITGYRPEELYADPGLLFALVDPEDQPRFAAAWRSAGSEPVVIRWRRRDGATVWTEQRTVPVHDADGNLAAIEGVLRDVTSRLRAEQEHDRLQRQLVQAERLESLGLLAGGIAHDFNNLLAVIAGYTDLVAAELPAVDPRRADLDGIRHAAQRGAALTRQLLIFSRREPSRPETLDINAVVADTDRLLRRTLGEDIELVTLLEAGLCPVVIDRSKLEQIIMNLVMNARTAMPGGGTLTLQTANVGGAPKPSTAGQAAAPAGDRLVRLTVADSGTGMPPEVAEHVFEPFFTTKGPGNGAGLGLATVYGVVTEAGGEISIWTESGRGTRFHIDLPAAGVTTAVPARPRGDSPRGNGETILVVEDEDAVREITRRILAGSGYRVLEASTAAAALELVGSTEEHIDAVLTDAVMPGMSGPQLIERLQRVQPTLPAMLMSGYAASSLPGRQTLPDTTPLIRKPFDSPTLLRRVREIVDP